MLKVEISWVPKISERGEVFRRNFVERVVRRTFKAEGEVGIVFCDGNTIRRLNRKYRKVDRVTDVLSFPLKDSHSQGHWGEVYICLNQAVRQAHEYNHSLAEEITLLIAHGLKGLVKG